MDISLYPNLQLESTIFLMTLQVDISNPEITTIHSSSIKNITSISSISFIYLLVDSNGLFDKFNSIHNCSANQKHIKFVFDTGRYRALASIFNEGMLNYKISIFQYKNNTFTEIYSNMLSKISNHEIELCVNPTCHVIRLTDVWSGSTVHLYEMDNGNQELHSEFYLYDYNYFTFGEKCPDLDLST